MMDKAKRTAETQAPKLSTLMPNLYLSKSELFGRRTKSLKILASNAHLKQLHCQRRPQQPQQPQQQPQQQLQLQLQQHQCQ